jgi:glycerol kinase
MATGRVLALDQGTTSSRAVVFSRDGVPLATAQRELPQIYPRPGEVEHDPEAIWSSQLATAREALAAAGPVDAVGITNQRETTILWDRATGAPVANAIVWQSRVSAPICDRLRREGHEAVIRERTGLVVDPYFSATKIAHLLETIPGLRGRAERGEIAFGTVDSFLIWRLTGGRSHVTDVSNASRTLLLNLRTLDWDDELLRLLGIPRALLPRVVSSCLESAAPGTDSAILGAPLPIAGIAGDQQAATFGQACFEPGQAKNTYGTGCFLLMNVGPAPKTSANGLLSTVGWRRGGRVAYCLEGSVFVAGAAVQWLRDGLGLLSRSDEIEGLAGSVPDSGGVHFVPAFVGLGAPYWDSSARGALLGLTRGTSRGHIARAAVESMAFQTVDVLDAMRRDSGLAIDSLRVDGGAARNDAMLQFQADLLGARVLRPRVTETTALGAAYLAGLGVSIWASESDVAAAWAVEREFTPSMTDAERRRRLDGWRAAVARTRS